ncbi:MAG TPA: hypothetical protein VK002_06625 [Rubricoccaceae bacterium]|nr:hypothetical protein [Rubricoccaceae bacterium]
MSDSTPPDGWQAAAESLRTGLSPEELDEVQALLVDLGQEREVWRRWGAGGGRPPVPTFGSVVGADASRLWQELDGHAAFDRATLSEAGVRARLTPARLVAAVLTLGSVGLLGDGC